MQEKTCLTGYDDNGVAVIALLPVLTSTGKGAYFMVPLVIPTFGGMILQVMTIYAVPIFHTMCRENAVKKNLN